MARRRRQAFLRLRSDRFYFAISSRISRISASGLRLSSKSSTESMFKGAVGKPSAAISARTLRASALAASTDSNSYPVSVPTPSRSKSWKWNFGTACSFDDPPNDAEGDRFRPNDFLRPPSGDPQKAPASGEANSSIASTRSG
ncbi:hypothetical protein RHE_CH02942 [Rhizobium etli CFN 42]|uniref:Uncharacterized protein n=1 Tax=Rhizobium etli (strain ATCC 51251 / DSM 11541 / JCM 21823 / NBRC 15573 / CFN 42) TaxID=347834 RepID=Q2K627_RHIEC|nr:hypothetical protein RHE_CH02942 [Rhizobium etli CFN 42]